MSREIPCHFKSETTHAVLIVDSESGEEVWFPFSQVESMHKDKNGNGTIVVTDWIAAQKGY